MALSSRVAMLGRGASKALTERWRRDEIEMFKRSRPIGFSANPERLEEAATDAYTSVHRRIASQFTAARNELAEMQVKRDAVRREAQRHAYDRSDGSVGQGANAGGSCRSERRSIRGRRRRRAVPGGP